MRLVILICFFFLGRVSVRACVVYACACISAQGHRSSTNQQPKNKDNVCNIWSRQRTRHSHAPIPSFVRNFSYFCFGFFGVFFGFYLWSWFCVMVTATSTRNRCETVTKFCKVTFQYSCCRFRSRCRFSSSSGHHKIPTCEMWLCFVFLKSLLLLLIVHFSKRIKIGNLDYIRKNRHLCQPLSLSHRHVSLFLNAVKITGKIIASDLSLPAIFCLCVADAVIFEFIAQEVYRGWLTSFVSHLFHQRSEASQISFSKS